LTATARIERLVRARLGHRPPGYRYSVARVLAIYSGLMVVVILASLDTTIVSTALPAIVSDLGGLSDYSWVFSAFLLSQAISVPIWSKLGDLYGRRLMLVSAVVLFLTASVLCGLSQTMLQLIAFRSLQGIGAGGLIPLVFATIGEIVPPRDRGKYQGLISGMFGISAILGPAVGGLIVDRVSWRWIFFVNLPVGGVALGMILLTMPKPAERREHSIDYAGAALFAVGAGAVLLALTWGGGGDFLSPRGIAALFVGAVALAAFAVVERRAPEPLIPFSIVRRGAVATSAVSILLGAICFFGVISFVPLFVQGVLGTTATASAAGLTPFLLGVVLMSIASGQFISRTGRYRINALMGPVVLGAGMYLLSRMGVDTSTATVARNMAITGAGLGLMNQTFHVTAQNAVPLRAIGATTGLMQFSRALGTALGVTLFGTIIIAGAPEGALAHGTLVRRLSAGDRAALASAFETAFLLGVGCAVAIFAVVFFFLKERPLRTSLEETEAEIV
jgi:EmrB/QacA subfamily drug resistance transporter